MISQKGDFILLNYYILGAKRVGKTSIINQYCIKSWMKNVSSIQIRILYVQAKPKCLMGSISRFNFGKKIQQVRGDWKSITLIVLSMLSLQQSIQKIRILLNKFMNIIGNVDQLHLLKEDQLQLQQINVIHIKDIKDKIFYQIFRVITKSQLRGISNQLGLQFFEVTAKDNSLIDTMFETIFLQCVGFFMKQGNIKQSNLCLYYQDQNKGLQKCIYEYKMKSKIYIAISVLFVCLSILCFSCINNIISPSIEGTIYGLIIFSLILTITILNMRNII